MYIVRQYRIIYAIIVQETNIKHNSSQQLTR